MAPTTTFKDYLWCLFLASPWIGIQCLWATEFGVLNTTMEVLGLPKNWAKLSWIWGPVTGFFTAPVVGAFSDVCTSKYGRRRPYMIGGLVSFAIASFLFAFCQHFGSLALPVGFISYIALDITINVIQTPIRSFTSDMVPEHLQNTAQLMAVACQGTGGIIGTQLQANLYKNNLETLPYLIITALALNVFFISLVSYFGTEQVYVPKDDKKLSITEPFTIVFKNVSNIDRKLASIFATQFFSWAALFAFWPHATSWVIENVYKGCVGDISDKCPADLHQIGLDGNKAAADASSFQNIVQIVFGILFGYLLLNGILKSVKYIYAAGLFLGCAILVGTNIFFDKTYATIFITLMGVQMSVMNAFPFAIVGRYNSSDGGLSTGVQFGMMNMFICSAQFIVQFIVFAIPEYNTSLLVAGCFAGTAGVCALTIVEFPDEAIQSDAEKADKK
ncbi:major facilitator superfamily domain-containing protein [Globomyces pollinis-pini]|nr:major facilitator superfamily domain-containing protein [Globomyces pollinis-pini]